jgi:hypothetical protein
MRPGVGSSARAMRGAGPILLLSAVLATTPGFSGAQQPPPVRDAPREEARTEDLDAVVRDRDRRQAIPVPRESALPFGLAINGALRGGVQWIVDPPRAKDDVFGFGALDVLVVARPTPNVTLLIDVEGLVGPGPDQGLSSLSRLNAEAERLEGHHKRIFLREAWVRLQTPDAGVRFNVGKLDVTHYFDRNFFAEDETRQFLNAALIGNPMLRPPPNGPAASIRISQGDWRYAFGVHAPDDFDGDMSGLPYIIGELGHRNLFALKGHYRWWARVGSVQDRRDDVTWGTGISIDQLVAENTGVFFRAGLSRSENESLTSHAVSLGVQHTPTWIQRDKDLMGIGYGYQRETDGREHVLEAYYNLTVAECCALIASVEWIFGRRERSAVVPGIRGLFLF